MILNRIYMSMDLNACENTNKTEFLRSVFIFMLYVGSCNQDHAEMETWQTAW